MAKNITVNIDEDVTRLVRKLSRVADPDITLVLPKGSLLFFDIVNLKLLKKQTDQMGKNISVLTMDPKGQQKAAQVGFALKSFEELRRMGPSMDAMPRRAVKPVSTIEEPTKVVSEPQPVILNDPIQQPLILREPIPEPVAAAPIPAPILNPLVGTKRPQRRVKNFLIASALIGIVLAALLAAVVLPKADLIIYAHSQPLNKDLQINLDKNASDINVDKLVLPVEDVNKDSVINQRFDSTGQVNLGNKAAGKIQIYNFTGKILRLNAGTTVLKAGDKEYVLQSDATSIKPTRYFANTKDVDPASLTAPVTVNAKNPGEDSNIPAGAQVEIINQVLGPLPVTLYATSLGITGGTTRLSQTVTQSDLDNAAKTLKDLALNSASADLLKSQGLVLPQSGNNTTVKNLAFDKIAGDQSVSFTGTITLHIEGAGYKPEDLKSLVRERLAITLGSKALAENKEKITTSLKSYDPAVGKGFLAVHYEGAVISKIDAEAIKSQIPGKTTSELREYLLSNPDIDGVEVTFSPFWVKSVPKYSGKINLDVRAQ